MITAQEILNTARYDDRRYEIRHLPEQTTVIASCEVGYRREAHWYREELHQAPDGRLYLWGEGNPDSPYAYTIDSAHSMWTGGERTWLLSSRLPVVDPCPAPSHFDPNDPTHSTKLITTADCGWCGEMVVVRG